MRGIKKAEVNEHTNFTSSAKSVFRLLFAEGAATRPQLCAALELSRPTMSAAIAELDRVGYVEKIGEIQGAIGRKASMYRLGAAAGHIIAIDAGSTHIRLRITTLDRRLLHSSTYRLPAHQRVLNEEISKAVTEEITAALDLTDKAWGPLRAVGIALPSRVVGEDGDRSSTQQEQLFTHFTPPDNIPLILENNVNCAAIAENNYGSARGKANFAYVQVGVKIGMGVILNNSLLRGRNGAAGEISHLPYPWAPQQKPVSGELEIYLGADALMQRVRDNWSDHAENDTAQPAPHDTTELLLLAEQGNAAALQEVVRHAENIGAAVAACVAMIDPGYVVLGGGIGNSPLLLAQVRETVNQLSYPTEIQSSTLGSDATLLGIEKLAVDHAAALLIGTAAI